MLILIGAVVCVAMYFVLVRLLTTPLKRWAKQRCDIPSYHITLALYKRHQKHYRRGWPRQ